MLEGVGGSYLKLGQVSAYGSKMLPAHAPSSPPPSESLLLLLWVNLLIFCVLCDVQKRKVLSDPTLPPEFRISLARSLRHDLFFQVCVYDIECLSCLELLTVIFLQIPFLIGIQERVRATFTAEVNLLCSNRLCFPAAHHEYDISCLLVLRFHILFWTSVAVNAPFLLYICPECYWSAAASQGNSALFCSWDG